LKDEKIVMWIICIADGLCCASAALTAVDDHLIVSGYLIYYRSFLHSVAAVFSFRDYHISMKW